MGEALELQKNVLVSREEIANMLRNLLEPVTANTVWTETNPAGKKIIFAIPPSEMRRVGMAAMPNLAVFFDASHLYSIADDPTRCIAEQSFSIGNTPPGQRLRLRLEKDQDEKVIVATKDSAPGGQPHYNSYGEGLFLATKVQAQEVLAMFGIDLDQSIGKKVA